MKSFELDCPVGNIYPCHVSGCSYVGKTKDCLRAHLRSQHFGKKLYCEYCGYWTRVRTHLNNHVKHHTGEKPFCCTVCGNSFAQKIGLKRHMGRKHLEVYGELLLRCDRCDYQAPDPHLLKQHMFKHQMVQSDHYCKPCGRYFCDLSHLQKHCKSKKHQRKAFAGESEATNFDETGLQQQQLVRVSAKKSSTVFESNNFEEFNENAHLNVTNEAMKQLVESKYVPQRHFKQQRRIRKGKPPKDTMFKCKWCKSCTGDAWDYLRHLRKIKLSD